MRNAELIATQRMEAAEQRKLAEKARRLEQERARALAQKAAQEKVAAQTFARDYLGGLIAGVFQGLTNEGVFYDPVEREVGRKWLLLLRCCFSACRVCWKSADGGGSLTCQCCRYIVSRRNSRNLRLKQGRDSQLADVRAPSPAASEGR